MKKLILGAAALLASLVAFPAAAANLTFTLTSDELGTIRWQMPASPAVGPEDFEPEFAFFLPGPYLGDATAPTGPSEVFPAFVFDLGFYSETFAGGFDGSIDILLFSFPFDTGSLELPPFFPFPVVEIDFDLSGAQLYTGPESAPTFAPGTYTLTGDIDVGFGCSEVCTEQVDTATLVIGNTVPEPGTWALMILGFGAAGAMLRRRRLAFA